MNEKRVQSSHPFETTRSQTHQVGVVVKLVPAHGADAFVTGRLARVGGHKLVFEWVRAIGHRTSFNFLCEK